MLISDQIGLDLLRLYAAACRQGSLSKVAQQTGRSQSAVSMQIRRLEELVGHRLFRRTGRGVVPTAEGEVFLGYVARMLALGDEAQARLSRPDITGSVRIGLAEEVAGTALPAALGRLHRAHPGVQLDVMVTNSIALGQAWNAGQFDIMLAPASVVRDEARTAWTIDLLWACALDYSVDAASPLDLVAYAAPCLWRDRMMAALAATARAHRIVFASQSISALQAAVEGGLGMGLLPQSYIRPGLSRTAAPSEAPEPITVQYGLYARDRRPACVGAAMDILLQAARPALNPASRGQRDVVQP
ncbi:MAG: LysR family transcriptional regulator [Sphingomonas sp.]|uniref:LysR family transcriptional regulator n=1 Tax=Sphingomonas sp. TaxID=28214 RepID=UPI001B0C4BDF|nr:LysR substrate-binding domain-containing protein [Sphingomonas sp.]MBO9621551.1 LysR family transcriptional regulator [Sphingomonas sp.]